MPRSPEAQRIADIRTSLSANGCRELKAAFNPTSRSQRKKFENGLRIFLKTFVANTRS